MSQTEPLLTLPRLLVQPSALEQAETHRIAVVPVLSSLSPVSTTLDRFPHHLAVPSPSSLPPTVVGPRYHSLRPPDSAAASKRRRAAASAPLAVDSLPR
jgi:hypothetical protein